VGDDVVNEGCDMKLPSPRPAGRSENRDPAEGLISTTFDGDENASETGAHRHSWSPSADVIEVDGAYVIEVELPGVRREDVDVDLDGNEFVVTGEVKEREREGFFRHRTRSVGHFEFRVTLPGELRREDVEVSLAYGVLKAYVPKVKHEGGQTESSC
jgi:HSP20 family protein